MAAVTPSSEGMARIMAICVDDISQKYMKASMWVAISTP